MTISDPLISILIPAKNVRNFLVECLDSIQQQSYQNWEAIIINDHSSDETFNIALEYTHQDKRFKLLNNLGSGIIPALQLAFKYSKGELITRMDADDVMSIEKLALMSNKLLKRGPGHIAIGCVQYFSTGYLGDGYKRYENWLNKLTRSDSNFEEIYKECTIPSPCWMVYRGDLEESGGFNSDIYPEDYDLAFRFRKAKLRVSGIDKIVHLWRDYPERSSRTDEHYSDNRFTRLKIHHFISQDLQTDRPLILWGAGNKGKAIAKEMIRRRLSFQWICNNPRKIGIDIYGVKLHGLNQLNEISSAQVIIAVSSINAQSEIIERQHQILKHDYFWFC